MKTLNKTVMTSFVLAMSANAAFAEGLTLEDIITQTLATHPEYQASEKRVESARQGIVQAKAAYLPKADVTLGTGYERVENQSTINKSIANPSASDHADENRQEASLSVSQMLFDGFATPARVEMARANLESEIHYNKEIAEKVSILATEAYYSVLREQSNLVIDKQNLKMHLSYQEQIQKRVRSGKSNKADLEQVNSRVALAESQVVQREELLEQAKSEFFRQVGMEPENLLVNEIDYSIVPSTLDEAREIAFAFNPRIKTSEANAKSSESSVKEAKSAYMPTVHLELVANRNQNVDGVDKRDQSEQAMVRMRYNLFNGGADKARHLASLSDKDAAEKSLEDTKREVERDIRTAWYEYQLTSKRLASLNAQVRAANATKVAYKSQFDVGQRTLLDVLDSEREYNFARTTLQTAKLARDFSVYQLLSLMGTMTDSFMHEEVVLDREQADAVGEEAVTEEVVTKEEMDIRESQIEEIEPELSPEEEARFEVILKDINNIEEAR